MYAIVEIAGQQFKAEVGKKIFVHRLEAEKEKDLEFEKVLLVENDGKVIVGEPLVENYIVAAQVVDHVKGDKVIVFKMKKKKGYRVKNGHRQNFTQIEITGIGEKGTIKKHTPKKKAKVVEPAVAEEPVSEEKITAKKAAVKKPAVKKEKAQVAEVKVEKKKAAPKKEAEKKPAAKKSSKQKEQDK
jgi:large subunit ribosomal protein L21